MRVIILGAGRGARLMPHTEELPKCLVDGLGGKRILDWILEALHGANLRDIVLVGGYQIESVRQAFTELEFVENRNWATNNVLQSLFCAENLFEDGFIVSYSDIVYRINVVQRLVESNAEVAIVVDRDWRRRYVGRDGHPELEAEKVVSDDDIVRRVGKYLPVEGADGEFIGLARFSGPAVQAMKAHYHEALERGEDEPFGHAPSLREAFLPEIIEKLIDGGVVVRAIDTWGDWVEIDTPQDLAFARELLADGVGDSLARAFWAIRAKHYEELEWAKRDDYLGSVLAAAELHRRDKVLDVGTGTGIVAHAIAPRVAKVVGIDISPDMLAHAIERRTADEIFEEGDVRNLRYPSAHFDKVVARMVFHHVMPDPVSGVRECYRVLKPGGLLVLSEGTPPDPSLRDWYTHMFDLKEERLTFLESDIVELLVTAGFEVHRVVRHLTLQVSIGNWLRSSGLPRETQDEIYQMHLDLDDAGKKIYNMTISDTDILCDFTFVSAVGRRPLKG